MIEIDEDMFKSVDFFGYKVIDGQNMLVVEFDGNLYRYVQFAGGLNYLKIICNA